MWRTLVVGLFGAATPAVADAQVALDRADPSLATRATQDLNSPSSRPPASPRPALAPSPAGNVDVAAGSGVVVRAIEIVGGYDIAPGDMAAAVAPYVGHRLSQDDLRDLLGTVSGVARARGYIFARSSIPAQALAAGNLRVTLDEGYISAIRLTGASDNAVGAILAVLRGHAPKQAEVERQLMLAEDLPGIRLGQPRYVREGDDGVLEVPVTRDRIVGRGSIDNRGTRELGFERAQLAADLNGLVNNRDQLSVQALVTPFQPRDLQVVSAQYSYWPTDGGTQFGIYGSYGRTRSDGYLRQFNATGESESVGVAVTQPVLRGRRASLWLGGGLDYVAVDEHFSGTVVRRDRLATANLSVNGYVPLAGGRLRAGLGVIQGIDALGATRAGDPLASRPDADGRFTVFSDWANWAGTLIGPFSARLAITSQLSTQPLLAVEQITIGGPAFGRAYDFSERSGDQGVLGSSELQARVWHSADGLLRSAQLYTFADAGRVINLRNAFGTGQLYSAGIGARLTLAHSLMLGGEAAFPINANRSDTGTRAPRLSASLSSSF